MHLTLLFLGELDLEALQQLQPKFELEVANHESFELSFQGVGAFPSAERPRVVWAGLASVPAGLTRLKQAVDRCVLDHLEPEQRSFSPHITLIRMRRAAQLPRLTRRLRDLASVSLGVTPVKEVELIQSTLHPTGASYTRLQSFELEQVS